MAKEQMIVFLYDMEYAEDEKYDPINAVLYFYPSWVSVIQKVALCGQLMGISHFLKCCFFRPKIIALQNGKFVFKEFGRFLLAIGTDRNVKDYFLEHRANLFTSLISFFHRDLETLYNQINTDKYQKNVSEKLHHIFGTYLPILQSNENIFQNVPKLRIPKIAGNIFLDAMQTLQSCQQTKGVLGGVILYHNKIIASQLSVSLTKSVVCTYLHRIKSTAETITTNFHIPVGVHMIVVYIPADQYHVLASDAYYYQNLQTQNLSFSAFPIQFQKRKLKKERSIVFTNIPEENNCDQPDAIEKVVKTNKTATRPTYLQLRGVPSKTVPQSNFNSSITEKVDSFTEFPMRPSVCSTPLTENKVLYGNGIMSICANPTESSSFSKIKSLKLVNSFKVDLENICNSLDDDRKKMERRNSFTDLQDSLKMISKKFFSKQKNNSASTGVSSPDNGNSSCNQIVRAISDPIYPSHNSSEQSCYPLFAKCNDQAGEHEKSKIDIQQFLKDSEVSSKEITPISDSKLEFAKNIFFGNIPNAENGDDTDTQLHKKSLSLPLKKQYENENKHEINDANEIPFEKNQIPKVPLTPLLAKLSLLELNEKSYDGISNCNNNTQCRGIAKSSEEQLSCVRKVQKPKDSITGDSNQHLNDFQKAVLYVCGQQNMTMLLLLEQDSGNKQEIVQSMFDKSVAKLSKMESHLYQTLNVNMMEGVSESVYSLICIDSKWNTLLNVGPWTTLDQTIIEHVHTDLSAIHTITDIFLRTNNCTLYTHKSGRTEFFYKECAHFLTGIPPPSDSMGTIGSRAKLRLEKDCSMVVF